MKAVLDDVLRQSVGRRLVVFLDYDGTLSPIVERPEAAVLSEDTRAVLRSLARHCPLAVVSGRDLADVCSRVGIPDLYYAGSHGFEIEGPGVHQEHPLAHASAAKLRDAADDIAHDTLGIAGVQLETKRFAVAVHYRRVREAEVPAVRGAVERALARHSGLRLSPGKKVLDLQPDIPWDKGRAVLWLLQALQFDREQVLPLYIGDDLTDEDAFRAIGDRGVCIAVQEHRRRTAARFTLRNPVEVQAFLADLSRAIEQAG